MDFSNINEIVNIVSKIAIAIFLFAMIIWLTIENEKIKADKY